MSRFSGVKGPNDFGGLEFFVPFDEEQLQMAAWSRAHQLVDAGAVIVRDEIVEMMANSTPTGREYRIPGTGSTYTASAPGQPPAEREGLYLAAWKYTRAARIGMKVAAVAYNDRRVGPSDEYLLGELLEYGTSDLLNYGVRMEPRLHIRPALPEAERKIAALAKQLSQ